MLGEHYTLHAHTQEHGQVGCCMCFRLFVEESNDILNINNGQGIGRCGVGPLVNSCSETCGYP